MIGHHVRCRLCMCYYVTEDEEEFNNPVCPECIERWLASIERDLR